MRYIRNTEEQQRIIKACHSDVTSGHLGYKKTMSRVTERFTWYGMTKDIEEVVSPRLATSNTIGYNILIAETRV